ncbi:hypothetical protein D9M71_635140 [compost metagenome]
MDGAVDVGFRSEVQYCPWAVFGQESVDQVSVADIAVYEGMTFVAFQAGEILQVSGIGQLVQADHWFVVDGEPVEYEVRANEAGAAGYENGHGFIAFEGLLRLQGPKYLRVSVDVRPTHGSSAAESADLPCGSVRRAPGFAGFPR